MLTMRKFSKRAGEYVNKWGVILDQQSQIYEAGRKMTSIKREHDDDEEGPKKKTKVSRATAGLDGMNTDDLRAAIAKGSLTKFTVTDLKDWLLSKGLNSSGKKADLVERIEQWVENA
jgi:ATP-dependent DNA helicase 2 subunit 1